MSDVVRNYTGSGGRVSPRSMRSRGGCLQRIVLAVLVVVLLLLWITRNSYDAGAFLPSGLRFNVMLSDPMNGMKRIASSNVWNAWPDAASRDVLLTKLRQDPGVPRWILNNLLTQRLYLAGDDVRTFSDVLAITHMSRIGVMLERFLALSSDVSSDDAGGLHMRHVESSGIYYAVRGRVLVVSPNRDALIRALTLRPGDTLNDAARENLLSEGAEDVRGTVELGPDDPLGDAFQSIAFAIRIDQDQAYAKCHGIIRESARERFGPLLNGAKPYALAEPLPGMIEVSANFGKPVREVWASLGEALQSSWLNAAQWQAWESPDPSGASSIAQTITGMIGPLGPALRLSCVDVDENEMVPVPIIVATVQVPSGAEPNLEAMPVPVGANPWDSYPRYHPETKLVSVPLAGGPSLEPSAVLLGRDLLISTSRQSAEAYAQKPPTDTELVEKANLFVRIRPESVVRRGAAGLRPFAEVGLLRDYTTETFDAAVKGWTESAARVKEVAIIASGTDEAIEAELRILCNPAQPLPEKAAAP